MKDTEASARASTVCFISILPRSNACERPAFVAALCLARQRALYQHGNDDDRALNRADQIFGDKVGQQHDVAHEFQDEGAADRAPDPPRATLQRGAAHNHSGDGL